MKKIALLSIITLFLFGCVKEELLEEIVIGQTEKVLVDYETKISAKDFAKLEISYIDGTVKIISEDKKFLNNLKIQKLDEFPNGIKLNLNQEKVECEEKIEMENPDYCINHDFIVEEDYQKSIIFKHYVIMGGFIEYEKRNQYNYKCLFEYNICDNNYYNSFTKHIENFSELDLEIVLRQYENNLIVDFYQNGEYLKTELFLVNNGFGESHILNLNNENVKRKLETLRIYFKDRVIENIKNWNKIEL